MNNSLYLRPTQLEILEDRIAPAALVVTNSNDNGAGSLRQAILDSNAHVGKDTIVFDKTTFADPKTITLMTNLDAITDSLVIKGPGADKVTIDGANTHSIFDITDGTTAVKSVAISGLSLIHGKSAATGGAIHSTESLTVTDCVISGNSAGGGGGLAFSGADAKLLIKNSQFSNNSATSAGGMSALASGTGSIKILSSIFSDNQATGVGGGVFIATGVSTKASVLIDKCSILHNSTTVNGAGGGIVLFGSAEKSSITLHNSIVSGNTSVSKGGGIYIIGGAADRATKITLDSVIISNNASQFAADAGGGLIADGTAEDVLIIKKSKFLNNNATDAMGSGGGIALTGDIAVNISGATISGNKASVGGGGIVSDVTSLIISSSTISGNSVTAAGSDGGGIFSHKDNALVYVVKSSFTGNHAVSDGGGMHLSGVAAKVSIQGSTFTGNGANRGGGISVDTGTRLTVIGSNFEGNAAVASGGGIFEAANTANTAILSSTFTGNFASFGGALNISNGAGAGEIHVGSNKFIGNSATNVGGAAILGSDGKIIVDKNLIEQNSAVGSGGGLFLTGTGAKILTSNTIHANTTNMDGGGVFLATGTLTLNKDVIINNIANGKGGGIRNNTANPIVNNGAKVINNSAPMDPNIS